MGAQTLFEAALAAYDAGLCPVPAAEDGTKRPDGRWKDYQRQRPSREEVARVYANGRHGLGLVCGEVSGGLEMLELEARARDLWPTFRERCDAAGCGHVIERVRDGYLEETPTGGIHLLYRCKEVEGNLKLGRRLGPGGEIEVLLETRGEGGFTIVAPSEGPVHPTGKPWVLRRGGFETIADLEPEERAALLEVARSFDAMPSGAQTPLAAPLEAFWAPGHERWMDHIVEEYNARYTWEDVLGPHGWVWHHAHDGVSYWSRPGKDPREGHSATTNAKGTDRLIVFSSAVAGFDTYTGAGAATSYDRFGAHAVLDWAGDRLAAARALRPARPVSTPGQETTERSPEGLPPGLEPIGWADFWRRERVEEDWLIEPVVPRGRQVAMWATHKTGKSLIALEMAAAVASGRPCLGREGLEPIDVVYLDMEMTEDDLYDRLVDLGYGPDVDLSRLHYYLLPNLPPLDSEAGGDALVQLSTFHQCKFLVMDTMARVVAGEENYADTYRAFDRFTGRRLKALGVSVLRLDHGGKTPEAGQRGSSAKGDDVDIVWQLEPIDNGLLLSRRHVRMSWVPEKVTLKRQTEPVLRHSLSLEEEWPAGTKALAELLDELGISLDLGRRAVRVLLTEGGRTAKTEVLTKAIKYRRQKYWREDQWWSADTRPAK